jgi:hypothetical protein
MTLGKFSLRLVAFSLLVAVVLQVIFTYTRLLPTSLWWALVFMAVLTVLIYAVSLRALKMSVRNSMSIILGSMFFRMISSLCFLIFYLVINDSKDISYVIGFMLLYLLFQVFEIYHLVTNLRTDLNK